LTGRKMGAGVAAVIAVITVVGVGTYNISNFLNTDNSTNIDNSGDEWYTSLIPEGVGEDVFMASQCYKNEIPEEYTRACKVWLSEP